MADLTSASMMSFMVAASRLFYACIPFIGAILSPACSVHDMGTAYYRKEEALWRIPLKLHPMEQSMKSDARTGPDARPDQTRTTLTLTGITRCPALPAAFPQPITIDYNGFPVSVSQLEAPICGSNTVRLRWR